MKILFDQGVPVPLRKSLNSHEVKTLYELNWSTLKNGDLINRAEANGYDLLITTDQNLKYQQNLTERRIAILVLGTTSWPRIQTSVKKVLVALAEIEISSYIEVEIP